MMHQYTAQQLAWLKTWYRHWKVPLLTEHFNERFGERRDYGQIRGVLNSHGFTCGRSKGNPVGAYRLFSKKQDAFIRKNIKKFTFKEVADRLNEKYHTSFTERQIHSFTANHKIHSGRTGCFPKGHRPWNAGTKGQGLTGRNKASFKKGHAPKNRKRIGYEMVDSKDGYVHIKISERNPYTGVRTRFKPKHVFLWEKRNGPVPNGKIIMFRDGNMYNFRPENLICISKAEQARLNQMHYKKQPKELKPSVFALARLKTRIGELNKKSKR